VVNWQTRLDRPVPIVCRRMRRVFWVPRRYVRVVAVGMQGPFTIREMAGRTGYSLHGAYAALQSLAEMGIATTRSVRGCRGRSRMTVSSDASANVPSTVTTYTDQVSETTLMRREHSAIEPVADGYGAWRALRATLAGLA
jgi:hypothetical protein